jgi:hypothetical protein
MMMIAILALIGSLLGLRFSSFVLVPASSFCVISALAYGVAHGNGFWATIAAIVLSQTSIQLGYFVGSAIMCFATKNRVKGLGRNAGIVAMPPGSTLRV